MSDEKICICRDLRKWRLKKGETENHDKDCPLFEKNWSEKEEIAWRYGIMKGEEQERSRFRGELKDLKMIHRNNLNRVTDKECPVCAKIDKLLAEIEKEESK